MAYTASVLLEATLYRNCIEETIYTERTILWNV